ncbi:MAG TPA: serine/threonine-protein kinase, partial [Pirellulales bacterium]|nr:serine/threonine-protein kinase [Pirellulales bacterium]
ERPEVEEYFARYPHLAGRADTALALIYEEMRQQRESGGAMQESEWLRRFPRWRSQIETLLACDRPPKGSSIEVWFPKPGETFGEFLLLDQLGHGAHGCVYLARQTSLADRPVVLKVASLAGQEHLSLARLQHTYIMPLYWAQDDASLGLRALCMPFFGGASLSRLLDRLADVPPARRSGRDLFQALVDATQDERLAPPVQGPACRALEKASYVEAVCTIGACLAEALDYAHQRNVVHHDLKPSNVLIAADGQPLLLDFHLAQPALEPGQILVPWLGGTPGYMAPEQEAALAAMEAGEPVPHRVDGQADVFALGLLLCEALAGKQPPAGAAPARWLRRANPQVSAALADMLAKCMAHEPAQRYPSAAALAADLRRHLAHHPLEHVANRSLRERWAKWRRRRPHALIGIFLVAALVTSCLVIANTMRQRWLEAERALEEAELEMEAGRFQWAKVAIDRGLFLAADLPWRGTLVGDLQSAAVVAQRGYLAEQLHQVVERLRGVYGADGLPGAEAQRLETEAHRLWEQRQVMLEHDPGRHWSESQVKQDLVDLAVFWSDVHLRGAGDGGRAVAAREALDVLLEAERLAGPRLVLSREQAKLARIVGDGPCLSKALKNASSLSPDSPWEHYALGRIAYAAGDMEQADRYFTAAIAADPHALWSNFYHGRAAFALQRFDEALTAYTVCVALADRAGWSYYHRGLARSKLGQDELARSDFDRALALDSRLAAVWLDRGMLSCREGRYDEALSDFERATAERADAQSVAYGLATAYAGKGDRAAAQEQLAKLFALQPDHQDGRNLAQSLRQETPP